MGYDEKTAERMRRVLSRRRDVVEKKMIGGAVVHVQAQHVLSRHQHGLDGSDWTRSARACTDSAARAAYGIWRPASGWLCVRRPCRLPHGRYAQEMGPAGHRLRVQATGEKARYWVQVATEIIDVMSARKKTQEADPRFAAVVVAFAQDRHVRREKRKGFGFGALKVNGRIFAMMSSTGKFVVKLPKKRVDELVTRDKGGRFEPGPGRVMKEWFVLGAGKANWVELAREACDFVRALGKTHA